jgi:LPXTG-site transpeptidase (sortase) family protein
VTTSQATADPFALRRAYGHCPDVADDPTTMTLVRERLVLILLVTYMVGGSAWAISQGRDASAIDGPASMAQQLRYIGRDTATGLPAAVDDRFIAQVQHDVERYGKDARQPVPPPAPPASGMDIVSLTVSRLGIQAAPVRRYGLDAYGRLDVPQDTSTVGWNPAYNDLPGEGGSTFFAAHVEFGGRAGVFNQLSTLQPGDEVSVALSSGSVYTYRVTSDVDYGLAAIDMGAILRGREGTESITLMTCSGPSGEDYPYRTVVLAERVP